MFIEKLANGNQNNIQPIIFTDMIGFLAKFSLVVCLLFSDHSTFRSDVLFRRYLCSGSQLPARQSPMCFRPAGLATLQLHKEGEVGSDPLTLQTAKTANS